MKILAASRDEPFRKWLVDTLEADGHRVDATDAGSTLISGVVQDRPDLVVIDVALKGLTGFEALAVVRRVRPELPIVVISDEASEETTRRIAEEGRYYHFHKPLYEADFLEVVRGAASRRTPAARVGSPDTEWKPR